MKLFILSVLALFFSLSSQACIVRVYGADGDEFDTVVLDPAGFGTEVGEEDHSCEKLSSLAALCFPVMEADILKNLIKEAMDSVKK